MHMQVDYSNKQYGKLREAENFAIAVEKMSAFDNVAIRFEYDTQIEGMENGGSVHIAPATARWLAHALLAAAEGYSDEKVLTKSFKEPLKADK